MRLIKLLAYALLGYVAYEFYLGMSGSPSAANAPEAMADKPSAKTRGRGSAPGAKRQAEGGNRGSVPVAVSDTSGEQRTVMTGRGVR